MDAKTLEGFYEVPSAAEADRYVIIVPRPFACRACQDTVRRTFFRAGRWSCPGVRDNAAHDGINNRKCLIDRKLLLGLPRKRG